MTRIILTLAQARTLQRDTVPWPGCWQFALDTQIPDEPDNVSEEGRTTTGLEMIARGCSAEQIALQLNLKADGSALRQLFRLHARDQKKSR
jgi:hypothetical protein